MAATSRTCHTYHCLVLATDMPRKKGKSSSGRKGRRGWATDEQAEYLESCKASYLTVQSTKKTSEFWPPVWEEWFERWPLSLSEKDIENSKMMDSLQRDVKAVRTFPAHLDHVSQFTHI